MTRMNAMLHFTAVIGLTVAFFRISQGTMMDLSEEFTMYTNQNLTLSCQPRDSPEHLVYWYKITRDNKGTEASLYTSPFFTITKATVDDTAFYSCTTAEWGFWGIRRYIMINVIEPGAASCANGWSLYKNSCFMHSARTVIRTWHGASDYCNDSSARLARVSGDSGFISFISDVAKRTNASNVWIGSSRGAHHPKAWNMKCVAFDGTRLRTQTKCTRQLPFICERVLPEVPKDVTIRYVNSSTVRVGWSMGKSDHTLIAYHVELSTSSGNVVSRKSSLKERSLLLADLKPNVEYRVRVQAENAAGNGSSSLYVSINMEGNLPIIVTSTQNPEFKAGESITLHCGQSNQEITWYKDESDVPFARGKKVSIENVTSKDEGIYHCAVNHGPKGSLKVLVFDPPVITDVKGILLKQKDKGKEKEELLLLCNTANRHPLEYAWTKDGIPLAKATDSVKVSLEDSTAVGEYECQVSNLAGSASKTLIISPVGEPVEEANFSRSTSTLLAWVIAVLSVLLVICCIVSFALSSIGKRIFKISKPRKLTTQSVTSTEMVAIEEGESPGPVSRTENVTRDNDEVFPYDVIQTWTGSNGPYMSLSRRENSLEHQEDQVTQVRRPDYTNISPSNRNDSAANCMYAPLRLSAVVPGENGKRPYVNVNVDTLGPSDM